jgi:hypothetical protein
MEGIERLQAEVLEMNNFYVSNIFNYLKSQENLKDKFNNEEKSLREMYDFICSKAESLKQGKVAMVMDKVVYLWATMYFSKSNEELNIHKKPKITTVKKENKTEIKKTEEIQSKKEAEPQISLFTEVA